MSTLGWRLARLATRRVRGWLAGPGQSWEFRPPPPDWAPRATHTTLYLHVPFCRGTCHYCPYTRVPYDSRLLEPFQRAACAEVDGWADRLGRAELASVYIGGGTPTLALDAVTAVLERVRDRFRLSGGIGLETNPADVDAATVARLRGMGVGLVSLGVQSFQADKLALLGRRYRPCDAERALALLAEAGFDSVNADLMFALPGQTVADLRADLDRAVALGASQVTAYPLFTFPYSQVGQARRLAAVRLPRLRARRTHYRALCDWAATTGFRRVSVWGFARPGAPRYSSVTRDGYLGIGPGAGSLLPGGFAFNTFDFGAWLQAAEAGAPKPALHLPFGEALAAWWWFYWRLYDTRVPLVALEDAMGGQAARARRALGCLERLGLAVRRDGHVELTVSGAFWVHLAQNHFALDFVNTLWTSARREPWPSAIAL